MSLYLRGLYESYSILSRDLQLLYSISGELVEIGALPIQRFLSVGIEFNMWEKFAS